MIREDWTITKDSARPAGKPSECFYCHNSLGEQHKDNCVVKSKTVIVKATIEAIVSVPECWDENKINQHYNNGDYYHLEPHSLLDVEFVRDANKDDEEFYDFSVNDLES